MLPKKIATRLKMTMQMMKKQRETRNEELDCDYCQSMNFGSELESGDHRVKPERSSVLCYSILDS